MSLTRGAQLAGLVALGVVTIVLVVLAMTRTMSPSGADAAGRSAAMTRSADEAGSAVPASDGPEGLPMVVSVMGSDHVFQDGAWYYRAVPAEPTEELQRGVELGGADATAESMLEQLPQVAPGDVVLVALGETEIRLGEQPRVVVAAIDELVQGIQDRDGTPVLVALPPDPELTEAHRRVNNRLRAYSSQNDVPIARTYGAVSAPDGTFDPAFSDDGQLANAEGSQEQADVVETVLDALVAERRTA